MNKETKERILNLPIINLFYQLVLIKRAIEKVNKEKKINFSANFIMICYFFIIGFYIPFSFMLGPIFLFYFYEIHSFALFVITAIEILVYLIFALNSIIKNNINKSTIVEYLEYISIGFMLVILIFVIL